jgi:hypothetical protein
MSANQEYPSELKDEINDYNQLIKLNQDDLVNTYILKSVAISCWCKDNESVEYLPQALEAITLAMNRYSLEDIYSLKDKSFGRCLHQRAYVCSLLGQKDLSCQDLTLAFNIWKWKRNI